MNETLESLEAERDALVCQAEIVHLKTQVQAASVVQPLQESWGDLVDRHEFVNDTPGFGGRMSRRFTLADDRKNGDFSPYVLTEQDSLQIMGIGRSLATLDETSIGAMEALTNYTIGTGFEYEVSAKQEGTEDVLVDAVQAVIDDFIEANSWEGDLERELFWRPHRDGNGFLRLMPGHGGIARARIIQPENVTEPSDPRLLEDFIGAFSLNWKYGVASEHGDVETVHGYFVEFFGNSNDWEFIPEHEMVHIKQNVDRGIKLGVSDFFSVWQELELSAKLMRNTAEGAAIQATIAYIKEHAAGTTVAQIEDLRGGRNTSTISGPRIGGGTVSSTVERFSPGRVLDTAGMKYHAGPLGSSNAPTYIDIAQAVKRTIGVRWQMPEHLISGDASNNNFASILEAGTPFQLATLARQSTAKRHYREIMWKMLRMAWSAGRFSRWVGSFRELRHAVTIGIEAPSTEQRNKVEEEGIREIRFRNGILSPATWSAQADLDRDEEVEKGAKPQEFASFGQQGGQDSFGREMPRTSPKESVSGNREEAPSSLVTGASEALNGAQITAAIDVLAGVTAGSTAEIAAVELLTALGIKRQLVVKMVESAVLQRRQAPVMESTDSAWEGCSIPKNWKGYL